MVNKYARQQQRTMPLHHVARPSSVQKQHRTRYAAARRCGFDGVGILLGGSVGFCTPRTARRVIDATEACRNPRWHAAVSTSKRHC